MSNVDGARPLALDRIDEAADVLARAMADDPLTRFLAPDPHQHDGLRDLLFGRTIERALADGRVDAWGDPIVAVAVWLRRPALEGPGRPADRSARPAPTDPWLALLGPDGMERMGRFETAYTALGARARPDRHVYLDTIGVLEELRRLGIASALLRLGHAWADAEGLPCALDTLTDANVAFYERRGYVVVDEATVPGTDLRIRAMRRLLRTPG